MAAIDELALNYRCSIILCTATQPALKSNDQFFGGFENVREIAPNPPALFAQLKRAQVIHIGIQTDEQLQKRLAEHQQILIIVNNRRHARALYENTKDLDGATHLTTLMYAKHRTRVLNEVRQKLIDGKPCRLISTSLIEAGVDVDFPCVMRAEAGLDSIAQAAGRCNREGKRDPENSQVLVFQSPDWPAPPELDQLSGNMREVMRNHAGDLLAPEALLMYFKNVYWSKGPELDSKNLMTTHHNHLPKFSFPFQNIAQDFCMIESHLKPIIIEGDKEVETLLRNLQFAESISGIARALQPYLVQIPQQGFAELLRYGAIEPVLPEKFGEQFWRLVNNSLYDQATGLSWENTTFLAAESTVF
jgi:CRISPR-associated endonuclease/helicase Cas3